MSKLLSLVLICFVACLATAQEETQAPVDSQPENVQHQFLLKRVALTYPPLARQARIEGTVTLTIVIDKSGNVTELRLISGHPMLAPAVIDAVRQWKYKPRQHNGSPAEVETNVQVNFSLR